MKHKILIIFLLCGLSLFSLKSQITKENWETANLIESESANMQALSKAYGYVRFFYPNPYTQSWDDTMWIKFLMKAIDKVIDIEENDLFAQELYDIFENICPEIMFSNQCLSIHEDMQPPYYVMEHKGIGNLAKLYLGKDYTPIRYVEVNENVIYQTRYCYKLKENLYLSMPLAVRCLAEKDNAFKKQEKSIKNMTLQGVKLSHVLSKKKRQTIPIFFQSYHFRLADVMIRYNTVQHFYPYYFEDNLDETWEKATVKALKDVGLVNDLGTYYDLVCCFLSNVHDSHVNTWNSFGAGGLIGGSAYTANCNIRLDFVEEYCYIKTFGAEFDEQLEKGDKLLFVNNISIDSLIIKNLAKFSYSTKSSGLKKIANRDALLETYKDSLIILSLEKKNGTCYQVTTKTTEMEPTHWNKKFIEKLENDLIYIDLTSKDCTYKKFAAIIPELQQAKGIIFDVRGYPRFDALPVISHFITEDLVLGNLQEPIIHYPDQQNIEYNECTKWYVAPATSSHSKAYSEKYEYQTPLAESIDVPIVFLTDASALSFAETFLDMIKTNKVGTIIGESTAGCNGDATRIYLPFGTFFMTFNKFFNRDGSQHHGIGILPDIYCPPTLSDIQNGMDTQLEKAKIYLLYGMESNNR